MNARVIGALTLLLLAGCTQPPPTDEKGVESLFSDDEVAASRAACLQDKGWDVELKDGAIIIDLPRAQRGQYRADNEECLRAAGIDPEAGMSDEQYRIAYEWYSEIAACLSAAGWTTPDKPSFEVFRSGYDDDPWIPWQHVPPEEHDQASERCPVMNVPSG